jgi:hypothetical protein
LNFGAFSLLFLSSHPGCDCPSKWFGPHCEYRISTGGFNDLHPGSASYGGYDDDDEAYEIDYGKDNKHYDGNRGLKLFLLIIALIWL